MNGPVVQMTVAEYMNRSQSEPILSEINKLGEVWVVGSWADEELLRFWYNVSTCVVWVDAPVIPLREKEIGRWGTYPANEYVMTRSLLLLPMILREKHWYPSFRWKSDEAPRLATAVVDDSFLRR